MSVILLAGKLVVTPVLVGAASLAGRRWGAAVGGWLVGLPMTSAPVALFLALDQGARFAAIAAVGMLAGTLSQAVYALGYASSPQLPGWIARAGTGMAGFAIATVILRQYPLSAPEMFAIVIAGLTVALRLLPGQQAASAGTGRLWRRDVLLRMLAATAVVVGITSIAPVIGPYASGLVSPFPVYGAVIAIAAHRQDGTPAALTVLHGLIWGLFTPAVFFLVLALTLPAFTLAASFAIAAGAALVTQGASLAALRPTSSRRTQDAGVPPQAGA